MKDQMVNIFGFVDQTTSDTSSSTLTLCMRAAPDNTETKAPSGKQRPATELPALVEVITYYCVLRTQVPRLTISNGNSHEPREAPGLKSTALDHQAALSPLFINADRVNELPLKAKNQPY